MRHLQLVQSAKKVVSDSPGLVAVVDFATRIVISIQLTCSMGNWGFGGAIQITEEL